MSDEEDDIEPSIEVKVVLIGESGVGKSSIIKQYATNTFDPDIESSISTKYFSKEIKLKPYNKKIKFNLWDTAGQERYRSLAKIFYKDANIIIFVYDIRIMKSFKELVNFWYKEVKENSGSNILYAVVGNKNDLYNEKQVDDNDVKKWADSINAIFQLTSAKENSGIELLFENIGKKWFDPKFNVLKKEEEDRLKYEIKKNSKKNIIKYDDDNEIYDEVKMPEVESIKIKNKNNKKKEKCC